VTAPPTNEDVGAASTPTKLVVESVTKVFATRRRETVALEGVDMHVDDGELVCLLGSSGCGKSTLLSIIGGLEEATTGQVLVEGDRVIGPGADRGMVFQGYSLYPWLSVARNIAFGLQVGGWPAARRKERVDELLGIMGLTEFRDALPKERSLVRSPRSPTSSCSTSPSARSTRRPAGPCRSSSSPCGLAPARRC
jgi:ABC-type nitrate/sulfonate/bicarbonate transport system ATPase subunit